MREIKFRAWDGRTLFEVGQITFVESSWYLEKGRSVSIPYQSHVILMQYTGIKDKNGKEIYEGDIVRRLETDWSSKPENDTRTLEEYLISLSDIGAIDFNYDRFCIAVKSKRYDDYYHLDMFPGLHGFIEVIGNIYENPELLS
jgi:uncharacterized phage protein (TIGR01671 family)